MTDRAAIAHKLTEGLGLTRRPIALAFVAECPEGVAPMDEAVPSACSFWPRAEHSAFFASAEQHYNCPIGAMTMGFAMPAEVKDKLMQVVERMTRCGYIGADEPSAIATVGEQSAGIVYGPLSEFPLDPDAVLVWLSAERGMLFNEAAETANWTHSGQPSTFGRPTCAAVPVALNESRAVMSFGCAGMRTYTGIDDQILAAIPGDQLETFQENLERARSANNEMLAYYRQHKAQFARDDSSAETL